MTDRIEFVKNAMELHHISCTNNHDRRMTRMTEETSKLIPVAYYIQQGALFSWYTPRQSCYDSIYD
jgi:hypothetical protein